MTNLLFKDSAKERAEQVFLALDFNRDGEICENEFVTGCMQVLKQKNKRQKYEQKYFNRDGELCENEFVTGCLQVNYWNSP